MVWRARQILFKLRELRDRVVALGTVEPSAPLIVHDDGDEGIIVAVITGGYRVRVPLLGVRFVFGGMREEMGRVLYDREESAAPTNKFDEQFLVVQRRAVLRRRELANWARK